MDIPSLELKSIQYRRTTLQIIKQAGAGHTGGSLSCLDILNVLYNQVMNVCPDNFTSPDRDRYIHSKGHSVEALYTVLADRGFFPAEDLQTLCKFGSHLVGHPTRKINGIEQNTGALGHGLAVAVGIALAGKIDHRSYRVYTTMGDGELTEGSVWEASMSAAHYKLDNLVVIIDRNTLQITGYTENVMSLEPLIERFNAFGYCVREVNGNDVCALSEILTQAPFCSGKPSLVLAHTTKGKGISYIENAVDWHHHVPSDAEFKIAMDELDQAEAMWREKYAITEPR
jgi:transketolase